MGLIQKIFGSYSDKELKRLRPMVDKINALEPSVKALSDGDLSAKTGEFKERLGKGETLDDLLPEAFAVVREAGVRVFGQRIYDVQLIGGIVLHQGRISEMKTGEGKTHTSLLPAYLNALEGKGVHVVTVNEYLVGRDAEWMGAVHNFLGLSVGFVRHDMNNDERREAYAKDITYATNNELGFDYLRDNMVVYEKDMVQRDLSYAIIDEVDSILIDEARTPLIISGSAGKSTELYRVADNFVKGLKKGRIVNEDEALNPLLRAEMQEEGDFVVDEKQKTVSLTQDGVHKAERFWAIENLSDPENMEILHHVNNALKANYNMHLDQDYVVAKEEGEEDEGIIIVDEFTGRLMYGRRYSDGLHQAIEAKEGVKVKRESKTLATITFQNFFNKYEKKAGMTGTAMTEEGEFRAIYGMDVVAIPTNKPVMRKDHSDIVYKTEDAKFRAVVRDIKECHAKGQPVLVGTITIENSEKLSKMLSREGIKHEVLNAKYHAKEAEIIAKAGEWGAVTIATNMAGRGTDIMLGGFIYDEHGNKSLNKDEHDRVAGVGGLKIIGTERHESRRIDNQLRGRSGRQGDPGASRFYISLEDDLMRLFGSDRVKSVVSALGLEDDDPIENKMLTGAIENAQKKVEGNNFSTRKHLLDYDRVMNEQREIIYGERRKVLSGADLKDGIIGMIKAVIGRAVDKYSGEDAYSENWNITGLNAEVLEPVFGMPRFALKEGADVSKDELKETLSEIAAAEYNRREAEFTPERMREIERIVMLKVVDQRWMDHIDDMDQMRQGIGLRSYAQRDPIVEYKFLSYEMFEDLSQNIQLETVRGLFHVRVVKEPEQREQVAKPLATNRDETVLRIPKKSDKTPGRNDPCPCGSGKKYKYCHGMSK